jgi:hypothetical protein
MPLGNVSKLKSFFTPLELLFTHAAIIAIFMFQGMELPSFRSRIASQSLLSILHSQGHKAPRDVSCVRQYYYATTANKRRDVTIIIFVLRVPLRRPRRTDTGQMLACTMLYRASSVDIDWSKGDSL